MEDRSAELANIKNKQNNPFKIATIILSIAVLGLASFTIYSFGKKSDSITGDSDIIKDNRVTDNNPSNNTNVVISENLVIIPQWGIKLTIPDKLDKHITYSYATNYINKEARLTISAVVKGYDNINDRAKSLLVYTNCSSGRLYRVNQQMISEAKEANEYSFWYDTSHKVLEKDGYLYIDEGPGISTCLRNDLEFPDDITDEMKMMERESRELITEMIRSAQPL